MIIVDDVEDTAFMSDVLQAMYQELPEPKPKKKKQKV